MGVVGRWGRRGGVTCEGWIQLAGDVMQRSAVQIPRHTLPGEGGEQRWRRMLLPMEWVLRLWRSLEASVWFDCLLAVGAKMNTRL